MIPPYVSRDNENTWRWVTEDGIFQATTENYYQSFSLTFNRWMGTKYSPNWQRIMHKEQIGDTSKEYLTRVVSVGIEEFLRQEGIDVSLPQDQLDRIEFIPESKTVFRSVSKVKYKISWAMTWGTPWNKTCNISMSHYCTATIRCEIVDTTKNPWSRQKPFPDEFYECKDIELGWKRFNDITNDMRVTLMENLL